MATDISQLLRKELSLERRAQYQEDLLELIEFQLEEFEEEVPEKVLK